jgi:cysteine-rich repeat protein
MPRLVALPLVALLACGGDDDPETSAPASSSSADESSTGSNSGEASTSGGSSSSEPSDESSSGDTSTGSTTDEPASSTGAAAVCGDGVVEGDEACDDGDDDETNECTTACKPWLCGDGFLQPGKQETCDDGGKEPGDGCNENCQVELECGKTFTTDWCLQAGTMGQHTRCAYVYNAGHTCGDPEIRYGTNEGGIPLANDTNPGSFSIRMSQWCQQLGFAAWSGSHEKGVRDCPTSGAVVFFEGADEPGPHFVDANGNDARWRGPEYPLNEMKIPCDEDMIVEITCE